MRTFVEYFHDEHGNVIKLRTHYGHADELETVQEPRTGDRFYDMDNVKVKMYHEREGAWFDQVKK